MRRVQAMPRPLATGPPVKTAKGTHHTDPVTAFYSILPLDVSREIQNMTPPMEWTMQDVNAMRQDIMLQMRSLELHLINEIGILNEFNAMLTDDTLENVKAFYNKLSQFDDTRGVTFKHNEYNVRVVARTSVWSDAKRVLDVDMVLTKSTLDNTSTATTASMKFVASLEGGQYGAAIGPVGYAVPHLDDCVNLGDMRVFGQKRPMIMAQFAAMRELGLYTAVCAMSAADSLDNVTAFFNALSLVEASTAIMQVREQAVVHIETTHGEWNDDFKVLRVNLVLVDKSANPPPTDRTPFKMYFVSSKHGEQYHAMVGEVGEAVDEVAVSVANMRMFGSTTPP